jgi:hypothetical protein
MAEIAVDGGRGWSGACVDRASEDSDQSLDGGRMVSDALGRPESAWAALLDQLDADEGQRLLRLCRSNTPVAPQGA